MEDNNTAHIFYPREENMEDNNRDHDFFPREATIFAAICAITFIIVGVIGNMLTIIALIRSKKLRNHATTSFVISLCVSDLLFCAINMPPIAARYIHEQWIFGDTLCILFPFFFYGNVAASLLSMVAITINRYVLISHHAIYDRLYTRSKIILMILFAWLFSFSIMVPSLLGIWGTMGLDEKTFSCTILRKDGKSPKKFLFSFGFLLPCIVIVLSYSCIYWKVRQNRKNLECHRLNNQTQPRNNKAARDDQRMTKLMLIIFCSFLLCFLPLMLVNVADQKIKSPIVHILASVFAWASSVINPFIYAFSNRQYRQAYKDLFNCCKSNSSENPINTQQQCKNSTSTTGSSAAKDCRPFKFTVSTQSVKAGK